MPHRTAHRLADAAPIDAAGLALPSLAGLQPLTLDTRAEGPPEQLSLHGPDDPQRVEVEAFIRQRYRQHFGAEVPGFAPWLLTLRAGPEGPLRAAVGYRLADTPLFLERYLDAPIESLIGEAGAAPDRAQIAEVGHLCAELPGAGRRLIVAVAAHLQRLGVRWVACTLTEELRRLFLRLGLAPQVLGPADPQRLGTEAQAWGAYYEHRPLVIVGRLRPAVERLQGGRA